MPPPLVLLSRAALQRALGGILPGCLLRLQLGRQRLQYASRVPRPVVARVPLSSAARLPSVQLWVDLCKLCTAPLPRALRRPRWHGATRSPRVGSPRVCAEWAPRPCGASPGCARNGGPRAALLGVVQRSSRVRRRGAAGARASSQGTRCTSLQPPPVCALGSVKHPIPFMRLELNLIPQRGSPESEAENMSYVFTP